MSPLISGGFGLMQGLAPRDRRAILLGLAVLLPGLVYVLGVRPYWAALSEVRDRVAAERELLAREEALLRSAPTMPQALHKAELQARRYDSRMIQAVNGVLAEGELTDHLEAWAYESRVLLEEIRSGELARGEEPPPGLSVVRLHLRGESDLEGVLTFLQAMEGSQLLLRIRGLALEPEMAREEATSRDEGPGELRPTGVVQFQIIVDGFARLDEVAGPSAERAPGTVE